MKYKSSFGKSGVPFCALREFANPVNYLVSAAVGSSVNLSMGYSIFHSLVPYFVPLLIQSVIKGIAKFNSRDMEMLLLLPGERSDPAFVMDRHGLIITSTGTTKQFFKKAAITSIRQLLNTADAAVVLNSINAKPDCYETVVHEVHSHSGGKWYRVKSKADESSNNVLVWMEDITAQKEFEMNLNIVWLFSSEIIEYAKDIAEAHDIYDRLANLILSNGYKGVFIASNVTFNADVASGEVFEMSDGKLLKSGVIEVKRSSNSPLFSSREYRHMVSACLSEFDSRDEFENAYRFDERVKQFLSFPIENFVNYHGGNVTVIAFNKETYVGHYDSLVMSALVNTAYSATYMVDMVLNNEEKSLQIIAGLASASEHSDEMTGKHILRVNKYSKLLACRLGASKQFAEHIGQVAALHDIGKVAIPEIIKLQRKLTDEERRQMEMHSIFGAQIIEKMIKEATTFDPRLEMARDIALHHHQQWNGKGYPRLLDDGGNIAKITSSNPADYAALSPLKGGAIPQAALIVSLADKYDALRSARQYKPAFSHEKTTEILLKDDRSGCSGQDVFGKKIIDLYIEIQNEFKEIYESMSDE